MSLILHPFNFQINSMYGALFDIPEAFDDINIYNATLVSMPQDLFYSLLLCRQNKLDRFSLEIIFSHV
jgi:hypothetical protein